MPVIGDLSLGRDDQADQGVEHGGLAASVGADDAVDLATFHFKAQVIQDLNPAVAGVHVFERQNGIRIHVSLPYCEAGADGEPRLPRPPRSDPLRLGFRSYLLEAFPAMYAPVVETSGNTLLSMMTSSIVPSSARCH